MVAAPQLHLRPRAVDGREVVRAAKVRRARLVEDDARVRQVAAVLVVAREGDPQRFDLARRPRRVHGLDRVAVARDGLRGLVGDERGARVPLLDVVRVLAQHDGAQEQRPPRHEALEAREAQLEVELVRDLCGNQPVSWDVGAKL